MKKVILSLAVVSASLFTTVASAQISNDKGTFTKPVAGNVLVELQVSPNLAAGSAFSLNDPLLVNLSNGLDYTNLTSTGTTQDFANLSSVVPALKGRYFLSDNSALRVQLGMILSSQSIKNSPASGPSTKETIGRNGFDLIVGYEKHFSGAERLSTYAGADIMFGMVGAKSKVDNGTTTLTAKQSSIGFGLRAVTGFDYYFIPKVYLGAELGLGLSYNNYGNVKRSGGALTDITTKTGNFSITPFLTPAIRLGYNF
ncbi:MAG TPA: BT1926 family outer membrane beta-barrel protein [Cytophagaceae bacterium]|jgi:hypothetical protein|nr:BT1926 family outer membrane beta-barrel protein [Cytophagaceae bacterium]